MSNSEIIEWLKKKAETVTMPGARKMYQAAVRALEAQKDMVSRKTANVAICNACGKIDCDKTDKCEKLQLPPANNSEFPNSSDTISRQAAKDMIKNHKTDFSTEKDYRTARACVNAVPPAQPERIRSKWALHTYMPHNKFCLACRNDSPYNKRWDFCPNCGAEMEVTE